VNLQNEWYSLGKRLGLGPEPTRYLTHIKIAYAEPHRHYHTLEHVRDCLKLYHKTMHLAEFPIAIEIAIWFHDLVYDPLADDNEVQSAARCDEWLRIGEQSQPMRDEVGALILTTDHCRTPETNDQQILADIDLSILGSEPEIYDSYARDVRREYAEVSDELFIAGRIKLLEGLQSKKGGIFHNEIFTDAFGECAHENIRRELEALKTQVI
jgi:predicted metal-dependent HD superfamily phosphohydrolase